jgi:serine phosphatase RsbU (regulator of sigma subunit)
MSGEQARVLVVEDDEQRQVALTRQLEPLGFSATCVSSGDELQRKLGADAIDLVLLSLRSSRINAYQILRRLQGADGDRPPVVVVSSSAAIEGVAKCLDMGADDYVLEPLHPTLLKARLAESIERRRLRASVEQGALDRQRAEEALREREKYERDVHIGRQIQAGFLPGSLPQPPGWEVAARFEPAREVAGDWYDAFLLPQMGRVGIVIADVCDKGVGAALFMGLMRSLIRAFAQQPTTLRWFDAMERESPLGASTSPGQRRRGLPTAGTTALRNAIEQTNNYIAKNHGDTGMFATVFFGILDPASGQLLYINGGHEKPVIIGAGGIRERLEPTGLAVGMMPDSAYEIGTAQLQPGEFLVAYTDGVPEARDSNRKFFTEARLLRLLNEPRSSAAELLDEIVDNIRAHIADADQYDDVTLIAVRRAPAS